MVLTFNNETGVGCQTETVELDDASCQTDKEVAEIAILQGKEFIELKKVSWTFSVQDYQQN